jgi:hypothetical protein
MNSALKLRNVRMERSCLPHRLQHILGHSVARWRQSSISPLAALCSKMEAGLHLDIGSTFKAMLDRTLPPSVEPH